MLKKIAFLLALFNLLFLNFAGAQEIQLYTESIEIDGYNYSVNEDNITAQVNSPCKKEKGRGFEEINNCSKICNKCVFKDDGCWDCLDAPQSQKIKEAIGFFGKIKRFINKVFQAIVAIVKPNPKAVKKEQSVQNQVNNSLGQKILDYHNDSNNKLSSEAIENELEKAFGSAESISDLLKVRTLMMLYCDDMTNGDSDKEDKCRGRFMRELKKRGDIIKERLIDAIDSDDTSVETYKQVMELRVILMAGTSASNEGVWFSTENIKKVRKELAQKAKEWFNNALENVELVDIYDWYTVASAHSDISGNGTGLFKDANLIAMVQARARINVMQMMLEMDICAPNPENIKHLQASLAHSCEKLIGDTSACKYFMSGNLEAAYAKLYNLSKADKPAIDNLPLPTDCSDGSIETTDDISQETESTVIKSSDEIVTTLKIPTEATITENEDHAATIIETTIPQETNYEVDEEGGQVQHEILDSPPEDEFGCNDGTTSTCEIEEPICDEGSTLAIRNNCYYCANIETCENITTPAETCYFNTYNNELTGWLYTTEPCDRTDETVMVCIFECEWEAPMLPTEEEDSLCYQVLNGVIHREEILPCEHRPIPTEDISDCVSACLSTN